MNIRKRWLIIIPLIVVSPLLFYCLDCLFEIQRRGVDIDLNSGRMRGTYIVLGFQIRERIRETDLSKALAPEDRVAGPPDWRRVDTFVTGKSGLHSGRFRQIHAMLFEYLWFTGSFTPQAQRESARNILRLMRMTEDDTRAYAYYESLEELADQAWQEKKAIRAEGLPKP